MSVSHDSARGSLRILLRMEGLGLFAICLALYARSGASWTTFAWLFLLPDVSLAGYLLGPKLGAAAALAGLVPATALSVALIWAAHVGFDRALGYGLKYANSFTQTHLGLIGKAAHAGAARSLNQVNA
jgi:hypothetical protein